MTDIKEFTLYLMKAYGLSRDGLTKALGYKSKTSLARIMNGEANDDSLRKYSSAVRDVFHLTDEEDRQLSAAVNLSLYGKERYYAFQALWDFIQNTKTSALESDALRVTAGWQDQEIDLLERYSGATDVRLTVVNCQYVNGLFALAGQLLRLGNATMEHFIHVDEDDARTIYAARSLMTVFYENGYMGYARVRSRSGDEPPVCGLNDADLAFVSWRDGTQAQRSDVVVFSSPRTGYLFEISNRGHWALEKLGLDRRQYRAIKREYFKCSAFSDYEKYSEDYAALERNHAIWKIKPDVGVDQIPAWILRKAVQEGCESTDAEFIEVLDRLEQIYAERYKNTTEKRKHAFTVFKRGAMRRFALTGRTTDHFWMMRPYTPQERGVILRAMLDQQLRNPFLNLNAGEQYFFEVAGESSRTTPFTVKLAANVPTETKAMTLMRSQQVELPVRGAIESINPAEGSDAVATIDENNALTLKGTGNAVIEVTYDSGKIRYNITVVEDGGILELPASLKAIQANAFAGNTAFKAVKLNASIETIDATAFADTSLVQIIVDGADPSLIANVIQTGTTPTILCAKGSAAEQYAIHNKLPYACLK